MIITHYGMMECDVFKISYRQSNEYVTSREIRLRIIHKKVNKVLNAAICSGALLYCKSVLSTRFQGISK